MKLASTRDGPCADEGFLSSQALCGVSLPIHKDKNNHGETWLIGLGDYDGGRFWIESPPIGLAFTTNNHPEVARVSQRRFCRCTPETVQIRSTLLSRSGTREGRSKSLNCQTRKKSTNPNF